MHSRVARYAQDSRAAGLLREALNADDFLLHAQPIASLADTNVICGYELLLRMRGKDGDTVSAAEIISAAQRYQLMPSIDRWVVQHATNRRSAATVQAIAQLAKGEGIDTVAEFVETPAVAKALRALGVDYGLGYEFGKPEPLDLGPAGVA